MIEATLLFGDSYTDAAKTKVYRYTFPSVGKQRTVSDEIRFKGLHSLKGKLISFKIHNSSNDFEISIRSKANVMPPHIDEILKIVDIDQEHQENELGLFFTNNDGPEEYSLYGVLMNNSEVLDTGITTVEFVVERM